MNNLVPSSPIIDKENAQPPKVKTPLSILKNATRSALAGDDGERKRKRKSLNRRVSFAPDSELTTHFFFEKSPARKAPKISLSPDVKNVGFVYEPEGEGPQGPSGEGYLPQAASPGGAVPMELTGFAPTLHGSMPPPPPPRAAFAFPTPSEITAALPSLGGLADEDEAWEEGLQQGNHAPPPSEITLALPSLGDLADEDEIEEMEGQQPRAPVGYVAGDVTAALPSLAALADEDADYRTAPSRPSLPPKSFVQYSRDPRRMSDVTAHVPSLAALLEEDLQGSGPHPQPASGDITLALPALSALVEEDEGAGEGTPGTAVGEEKEGEAMDLETAAEPETAVEAERAVPAAEVVEAEVEDVPLLASQMCASPVPPPPAPTPEASTPIDLAPKGLVMEVESPVFVGFGTGRRPEARAHPTPVPVPQEEVGAAEMSPLVATEVPAPLPSPSTAGLVSVHGGDTTHHGFLEAQRSKWGFNLGGDDTLTLDVRGNGAQLLGDTTFHHVYGMGDVTRKAPLEAQAEGNEEPEDEEEEDEADLPVRPWMLGKSPKPPGKSTPRAKFEAASPSVSLGSPVPSASYPGAGLVAPATGGDVTPQTRAPQEEDAEGAGVPPEGSALKSPSPRAAGSDIAPTPKTGLPTGLAQLSPVLNVRGVSEGLDAILAGEDEEEGGQEAVEEDLVFSPLTSPMALEIPAAAAAAAGPATAEPDAGPAEVMEEAGVAMEVDGEEAVSTPLAPPSVGTATLQSLLLGNSTALVHEMPLATVPALPAASPVLAAHETAALEDEFTFASAPADLDVEFGPSSDLPDPVETQMQEEDGEERPTIPSAAEEEAEEQVAAPTPAGAMDVDLDAGRPSLVPEREGEMEEGLTGKLLEAIGAEDAADALGGEERDQPAPLPTAARPSAVPSVLLVSPSVAPRQTPLREGRPTLGPLTGGATGLLLQPTPTGATARLLASATRTSLAQLSPTALVNQVLGRRNGGDSAQPASRLKSLVPTSARKALREGSLFTPAFALAQPPAPVQLTFQDFLKEAEVQFLDQLRRGTSLGMGDLAIDPPPATLRDAYRLMCITQADVQTMESGLKTLQDEIAARRARIGEKEVELSAHNPEIFRRIQTASGQEYEELKARVQLLKKVCRAQTLLAWKEWRLTLERRLDADLSSRLSLLSEDRRFLEGCMEGLREVHGGVLRMSQEMRQGIQERAERRRAHRERAQSVKALEESLEAQQRALQAKEALQKEEAVRLGQLEAKREALAAKKRDLLARLEAARARAATSAAASTSQPSSSSSSQPSASQAQVQQSLSAAAAALQALRTNATGVTVEAVRNSLGSLPSEVVLGVAERFRVRLQMTPPAPEDAAPGHVTALEVRVVPSGRPSGPSDALAAALARLALGQLLLTGSTAPAPQDAAAACVLLLAGPGALPDPLGKVEASPASLRAGVLLQRLVPQLQGIAQLVADLEEARHATPALAGVSWSLETGAVLLTLQLLDVAREGRVGLVVRSTGLGGAALGFSRLRVQEVRVDYAQPGSEQALQQAYQPLVDSVHASVLQLCNRLH